MYKILKEHKDWKKTQIEKETTNVFTVEDADNNAKEYEKYKKEWTAQGKVCKATIENIKRNHPEIYALSNTKKVAAKMLLENEQMVKEFKAKLAQVEDVLKKWAKDKESIMKKFNWKEDVSE
jgi:hypothetical protein